MSNLSEEEKKVLEKTKRSLKLLENNKNFTNVFYDISDLTILVSLINKQQKEIEELKEKNKTLFINSEKRIDKLEHQLSQSISKEKIRKKIEEYTKEGFYSSLSISEFYYKTEILKELLEGE